MCGSNASWAYGNAGRECAMSKIFVLVIAKIGFATYLIQKQPTGIKIKNEGIDIYLPALPYFYKIGIIHVGVLQLATALVETRGRKVCLNQSLTDFFFYLCIFAALKPRK